MSENNESDMALSEMANEIYAEVGADDPFGLVVTAILAERTRCAKAATTVFNESDTPYESASAGRIYKLITGREIDEDQP